MINYIQLKYKIVINSPLIGALVGNAHIKHRVVYIRVAILKYALFYSKPCRKIFQWEYLKSFQTICAAAGCTQI